MTNSLMSTPLNNSDGFVAFWANTGCRLSGLRNGLTRALRLTVLLAFPLLLACSDDDDDDPAAVVGVDGTGYYEGTAEIDGVVVTDLQGLVDGKRFMIISVSQVLLYEGTMNFSTPNEFQATAAVYQNGERFGSTSVSATLSKGASLQGTLNGSGIAGGNFTLTWADSNNVAADLADLVTNTANHLSAWTGPFDEGTAKYKLDIDASGTMVNDDEAIDGTFKSCSVNTGSISPIGGTALFRFSFSFDDSCDDPLLDNTSHTGLATHLNTGTGVLVFTFSNGSYAGVSNLDRLKP